MLSELAELARWKRRSDIDSVVLISSSDLQMCVFFSLQSFGGNMFNEDEDWSDEHGAQVLRKTVLKNTQQANSSTNVKVKKKFSLVICCKQVISIYQGYTVFP